MMEVIVTNEFTQMNAGTERRPFKVLTPPERSSAMVIARYSNRQQRAMRAAAQTTQPPDLMWKALRVGSVCAACAFAFFFVSQRNLFERVGETLGPVPADSVQRLAFAGPPTAPTQQPAEAVAPPDARSIAMTDAAPAPTFTIPEAPNLAVTEFNLSVTPDFQDIGNVQLRLTGVNAAARTYDITVRTSQREFYRQDVKMNEHLPLSRDSAHGAELVVGAIAQNRVFGYVSEPQRHGHRRRHRRG